MSLNLQIFSIFANLSSAVIWIISAPPHISDCPNVLTRESVLGQFVHPPCFFSFCYMSKSRHFFLSLILVDLGCGWNDIFGLCRWNSCFDWGQVIWCACEVPPQKSVNLIGNWKWPYSLNQVRSNKNEKKYYFWNIIFFNIYLFLFEFFKLLLKLAQCHQFSFEHWHFSHYFHPLSSLCHLAVLFC